MSTPSALQLWGGIECTVNRVGDAYFDQIERSGHVGRPHDLDAIAALGIRTLRYPLLWERIAPGGVEQADWRWADQRVERCERLGVEPIVGLVHHGSGPPDTHLLDPQLPRRLAVYARALAQRYPRLRAFTPVNEPLTTARFSALYGHWYPHHRDDRSFIRALLIQVRAIGLAMRAIREVNPHAVLVQTEDVAPTRGTPQLGYQVEFEEHRRWLSLDLLMGRVDRAHPLWTWLARGTTEIRWLATLAAEPCVPDVIGINYYATSERFLDHRTSLYPGIPVGGNGRHAYVDVEAVRVCARLVGCGGILAQAWSRYGRPLAITEAHLGGCSAHDQLRWVAELWSEAKAARAAGADVRALTLWAMLGSYDWPSLVTRADGLYEPGAFDVSGGDPRPTPLAGLARELATHGHSVHPALSGLGWWRRPDRLYAGLAAAEAA